MSNLNSTINRSEHFRCKWKSFMRTKSDRRHSLLSVWIHTFRFHTGLTPATDTEESYLNIISMTMIMFVFVHSSWPENSTSWRRGNSSSESSINQNFFIRIQHTPYRCISIVCYYVEMRIFLCNEFEGIDKICTFQILSLHSYWICTQFWFTDLLLLTVKHSFGFSFSRSSNVLLVTCVSTCSRPLFV